MLANTPKGGSDVDLYTDASGSFGCGPVWGVVAGGMATTRMARGARNLVNRKEGAYTGNDGVYVMEKQVVEESGQGAL